MVEYIFAIKEVALHGGYKDSIPYEKKEEIVRCRDCKRSTDITADYSDGIERLKCKKFSSNNYLGMGAYSEFIVSPDQFCAWGVRRND